MARPAQPGGQQSPPSALFHFVAVNGAENGTGTLGQQMLSGVNAHGFCLAGQTTTFSAQNGLAIDTAHQPTQPQLLAGTLGVTGNGYLATALQTAVQRPLGQHTAGGDVIVQGFNQFLNRTVVIVITHAPLNTQRALTTGRQRLLGGN